MQFFLPFGPKGGGGQWRYATDKGMNKGQYEGLGGPLPLSVTNRTVKTSFWMEIIIYSDVNYSVLCPKIIIFA